MASRLAEAIITIGINDASVRKGLSGLRNHMRYQMDRMTAIVGGVDLRGIARISGEFDYQMGRVAAILTSSARTPEMLADALEAVERRAQVASQAMKGVTDSAVVLGGKLLTTGEYAGQFVMSLDKSASMVGNLNGINSALQTTKNLIGGIDVAGAITASSGMKFPERTELRADFIRKKQALLDMTKKDVAGQRAAKVASAGATNAIRKSLKIQIYTQEQASASVANYANEIVKLMGVAAEYVATSNLEKATQRTARVQSQASAATAEFAANIALLRERAVEIGTSGMFSSTEVAEAMKNFSQLGFNAAETYAAIPDVLKLATAGELNMADATMVAGRALHQFNMEAEDMGRIVDVLAANSNLSSQSVKDLGLGLSYVGGTARMAGMSFEQTNAALAALADAGQFGSRAGTGLRQVIRTLVREQEKFKGLGIDVVDDKGNLLEMTTIIDKFNAKAKEMDWSEGAKLSAVQEIFPRQGAEAFIALLSRGSTEIRNYEDALKSAGGTAARMAEIIENTLGGSFRTLKASALTATAEVGNRMNGMRMFIGGLRGLFRWFVKLPEGAKQAMATVVELFGSFMLGVLVIPRLVGLFRLMAASIMLPAHAAITAGLLWRRAFLAMMPALPQFNIKLRLVAAALLVKTKAMAIATVAYARLATWMALSEKSAIRGAAAITAYGARMMATGFTITGAGRAVGQFARSLNRLPPVLGNALASVRAFVVGGLTRIAGVVTGVIANLMGLAAVVVFVGGKILANLGGSLLRAGVWMGQFGMRLNVMATAMRQMARMTVFANSTMVGMQVMLNRPGTAAARLAQRMGIAGRASQGMLVVVRRSLLYFGAAMLDATGYSIRFSGSILRLAGQTLRLLGNSLKWVAFQMAVAAGKIRMLTVWLFTFGRASTVAAASGTALVRSSAAVGTAMATTSTALVRMGGAVATGTQGLLITAGGAVTAFQYRILAAQKSVTAASGYMVASTQTATVAIVGRFARMRAAVAKFAAYVGTQYLSMMNRSMSFALGAVIRMTGGVLGLAVSMTGVLARATVGVIGHMMRLGTALIFNRVTMLMFAGAARVAGLAIGILAGSVVLSAITGLVALGVALGTAFKDDKLGPRVKGAFRSIGQSINDIIANTLGLTTETGKTVSVWKKFKEIAVSGLEAVAGWLDQNKERITAITTLVTEFAGGALVMMMEMWEQITDTIGRVFEAIGEFISENEAVFTRWGNAIIVIVQGSIGMITEIFGGLWSIIREGLDIVVGWFGSSWGEIGDIVGNVLEWMGTMVKNPGLSFRIMLKGIEVGFWRVVDVIHAGANIIIKNVTGLAFGIWYVLRDAFNNVVQFAMIAAKKIGVYMSAAWEYVKEFGGDEGEAAFARTVNEGMAAIMRDHGDFKNLGQAAMQGFNDGVNAVGIPGVTRQLDEARKELKALQDELAAAHAARMRGVDARPLQQMENKRQQLEDKVKKLQAQGRRLRGGEEDDGDQPLRKDQESKVEMIGLTDLNNKLRDMLTGNMKEARERQNAANLNGINVGVQQLNQLQQVNIQAINRLGQVPAKLG